MGIPLKDSQTVTSTYALRKKTKPEPNPLANSFFVESSSESEVEFLEPPTLTVAGPASSSSGNPAASSSSQALGTGGEPIVGWHNGKHWKMEKIGDIYVRQPDGSYLPVRAGRLAGPFGKEECLPHQMSWAIICSRHRGVALTTTLHQV